MRVILIEELLSEVTVNVRVVEHRVVLLIRPTELVELKLFLVFRLSQVEVIIQDITVPPSMLQ